MKMLQTMIVRLLAVAGVMAMVSGAATAQGNDQTDVQATISSQIQAFLRDDGEAAFGFASDNIRAQFSNATQFMAMVRSGYLPVYRAQSHTFGRFGQSGRVYLQEVQLIAPDGTLHTALYTLEKTPDGFRITGVSLREAPGADV